MKLALFQAKMSENIQENIQKSIEAIRLAAAENADMIIFPELQISRFFPQNPGRQDDALSMEISDPFVLSIQEECRRNKIMAVPNIYLRQNGKKYDASLVIDKSGEILGIQKMVHIAQAEQFYEQDYYTPADDGFHVFDTELGKIGIVVCFDRHYPESIRTEALMGAELIIIPTANTFAEDLEMFEWEVRVQAFQNSVAIAMCNRVGTEEAMHFAGESIVTDAIGAIVAKADDSEQLLYCEIEPTKSTELRRSKPYVSLRKREFYK